MKIVFLVLLFGSSKCFGYETLELDENLIVPSSSRSNPSKTIFCSGGKTPNLWGFWTSAIFKVDLKSKDYSIYLGDKPSDVVGNIEDKKPSWFYSKLTSLSIQINPFHQSCILVDSEETFNITLDTSNFNLYQVLMTLIGLIFFYLLSSPKSNFFIRWITKGMGLALVYFSSYNPYLSFAIIISMIGYSYKFLSSSDKVHNQKTQHNSSVTSNGSINLGHHPSVKLLTESEYRDSARVGTNKALESLRRFCLSPGSKKVMEKISTPSRFKEFLSGSDHVTMEEVIEYGHSASFNESFDLNEDDDDLSDESDETPQVNGYH